MNLPEGKLRVANRNGKPQFFRTGMENGSKGVYIPKKNSKLVQQLAQKDYYEQLVKECEAELQAIEKAIAILQKNDPERVYSDLTPARKALVKPLLVSDEEFIRFFEEYKYAGSDYHLEEKKFTTKKGDLVRSKSEAMIADMYYDLGIPYKYEYPLTMQSGTTYHVDFACLRIRDRKVIYHEHLGKMDDPGYVRRNLHKIDEYMKNGIFVGKNLNLTMESDSTPLNMKLLRKSTIEIFGLD